MNVSEAVRRRLSVRAFRSQPVTRELLTDILTLAQRAPSGGNLQPWKIAALTGRPLVDFKQAIAARVKGPSEVPDYAIYPDKLWEPYRSRRYQNAEALYATINIGREDNAARTRQVSRNFEFFGAPVGLFVFIDRRLGPPQWSDLGMYIQTFMLLAVERGLDVCAQESWALWPRAVMDYLGVKEPLMLFCGMALGYRDDHHPINTLQTPREPLASVAELRGF